MNKILTVDQAKIIANKFHLAGKTIVLAGGCFDILHIGHVLFLEKAKEQGDILMIMLESDETIRHGKGKDRPFHTQADRARVLASLSSVDYVILLPFLKNDRAYDIIVTELKPAVIALTKGDSGKSHKVRQAKLVGARLSEVIKRVEDASTTNLARRLGEER